MSYGYIVRRVAGNVFAKPFFEVFLPVLYDRHAFFELVQIVL